MNLIEKVKDKELVEHLIAQVTDCMAFKVDDK